MKLADLEPQFVRYEASDERSVYRHVSSLAESHGLSFVCPCGAGHRLLIWFADHGAPPDQHPMPRWKVSGSEYGDLTITPSIDSKCWHGWVTGGDVR